MKSPIIWITLTIGIFMLGGCTSRTPSIAHVHLGHAMTGWHDTPDKGGLFVTAEHLAEQALESAQAAATDNLDLKRVKTEIARVSLLSSSENQESSASANDHSSHGGKYGLKEALTGAVSHISYAATSPDASENVKAFTADFTTKAGSIVDRCDLIAALGSDIDVSQSLEEVNLFTPEILKLARANLQGEDLDGDGVLGSAPDEYGMVQLRRDIERMITREDPPYSTVPRWYLFNLIRLPDGSWIFRKRQRTSHGGDDGGY